MNFSRVPKVRFQDFKEEWQTKPLGKLAQFSKGKSISKADICPDGRTPCIRYGELYTTYGEVIDEPVSHTNLPAASLVFSEAGDVIIPASGETQIDIATASCVKRSGVALSGDLNILKTSLDGTWLAYSVGGPNKRRIAKMGQGNSVVHLYSTQLKAVDISYPTLPEQQKIAAFLTAVDRKLCALRRKRELLEAHKRGVMQRVFSKDSVAEWKSCSIGQLYSFYSTNSMSRSMMNYQLGEAKNIHYGDVHTLFGAYLDASVQQIPFINPSVQKKGAAFKQQVKVGDVILADASEDLDDIGKATEVVNVGTVPLHAGLHTIHARPDIEQIAPGFGGVLFRSPQFRKEVSRIAQGAKVLGISPTSISNIELPIPSVTRQARVAGLIRALDNRITLVERQLNGLQEFKRGLLQNMFV